MPGTAALRGLADPFDPLEAIPASAHYLRDLADRFGNLGLAAAAYNAGEKRVTDWRAGTGGLPYETRDYVISITGLSAEDWNVPGAALKPVERGLPPDERPPGTCLGVAALLGKSRAGMEVVGQLPQGRLGALGSAGRRQFLAQPGDGELCLAPEPAHGDSRRPAADGRPRGQSKPRQRRRSSSSGSRPRPAKRPATSAAG